MFPKHQQQLSYLSSRSMYIIHRPTDNVTPRHPFLTPCIPQTVLYIQSNPIKYIPPIFHSFLLLLHKANILSKFLCEPKEKFTLGIGASVLYSNASLAALPVSRMGLSGAAFLNMQRNSGPDLKTPQGITFAYTLRYFF